MIKEVLLWHNTSGKKRIERVFVPKVHFFGKNEDEYITKKYAGSEWIIIKIK